MSNRTFDWLRITLLALAVAGLLVSGQIVKKSEGEKLPNYMAWTCDGAMDCNKVLASPYAKPLQLPPYDLPISLGAIGMAYFTVLGTWLLLVGRLPRPLHHVWVIPALLGLGGLLGSVAMVYIMGKILHAWCGLCLLIHAIDLPLAMGIWVLWLAGGTRQRSSEPLPGEAPPAPMRSQIWKIPAMALLVGIAIGLAQLRSAQTAEAMNQLQAAAMLYDNVTNNDDYRKFLFARAKPVEIPIDADDPVSGPAEARHTLVVFGDFQCPHCADFAALVPQIQKNLDQPMRVVFKYFPLSSKCNPARPVVGGLDAFEQGCTAAAAAEAARRLGGNDAFWKAHDMIYQGHDRLRSLKYDQLAKYLGLDLTECDRLRNDPRIMDHIRRVAAEGAKIGVRTTPAIFLDGRRIEAPWKNKYDNQQRKRVVDTAATILYWKNLLTWTERAETRAASQPTASQPAQAEPSAASHPAQAPATRAADPLKGLPRRTIRRSPATQAAQP